MKSIINFSLFVLLTLAVFSCKDKAPSAADATEVAASAEGTKFVVAPEAAKINWEGSKPTGKHSGTINITNGELTVKDGALAAGSFTIDMNSITVTDLTGDEKAGLEEHLKGTGAEGADDFFSVTKFPTGKFEITSVTPTTEAGANAIVKGNLTLKDIAKEVSIPATITITGDMVAVTTNSFTINRTDWGINYASKNFFKEIGDKFIEDNIALQIMIEAKAATPAAAPVQ
jgi:polyisoprenoid-binding protein YceI